MTAPELDPVLLVRRSVRVPVSVGTSLVESMLALADAGWEVMPLSDSKAPRIPKHPMCRAADCKGGCGRQGHGHKDATTDEATIRDWARRFPSTLIGCRVPEDMVVLDIDPRAEGDLQVQALEREYGPLPVTLTVRSGRGDGGSHLYFWLPPGRVSLRQVKVELIRLGVLAERVKPGIDLKVGGRSSCVMPPSRHPLTKVPYCWEDHPVAELPAVWVELLCSSPTAQSEGAAASGEGRGFVRAADDVEPCPRMWTALEGFLKTLLAEGRHQAGLAFAHQVLRLRQQGHCGVAKVLDLAREEFAIAVQDTRGPYQALTEFDQLTQGAWLNMSEPKHPSEHAVCRCQIQTLRHLVETGAILDKGSRRHNQTKVMRYLLMVIEATGSLKVTGHSQRQIELAVELHQPQVSKVMARLEELKVLTVVKKHHLTGKAAYLLTPPGTGVSVVLPQGLLGTPGTEDNRGTAGLSTDTSVRAMVHPIFGADGFAGSIADTFAHLSEHRTRIRKGYFVLVRPGSAYAPLSELLLNPFVGSRQIPQPAPGNRGRTVPELAALCRRDPSTIRRHLTQLKRANLVFDRDGRWWRYRFDPEAFMAEQGIRDTTAQRKANHDRHRRNWAEYLLDQADADGVALADRTIVNDTAQIVTPTGQVLWQGPIPEGWDT